MGLARELLGRAVLVTGGILTALLLLVGLEGVFRRLDVGAEPGYFTAETIATGARVFRLSWNPQFNKPLPPGPWREFLAQKPPGTFRIFVIGESSAEGVPYGTTYSFARWLNDRLSVEVPDVRWEVVNAAIAGAQSGAMLRLVRDIAQHEPDLLVVYLGHNEIGAPMTAAERAAAGAPHLDLRGALARLRLYRVVAHLLPLPGKRLDFRDAERPSVIGTLERHASVADGVVEARLYRERLVEMVDAMNATKARTALLSLSQNFSDWPPVLSVHRRALRPDQKVAWRAAVKAGEALAAADCAGALSEWTRALALDDGFANLQYEVAVCEKRLGHAREAGARFRLASDVDDFSQGAPTAFNDTLRDVATREAALFVDVDAAFMRESGDHFVGDDLFTDAVHPNIRGHQLIARVVADAMREAGIPVPADRWRTDVYVDPDPEALMAADTELRVKGTLSHAFACYAAGRKGCARAQFEAAARATTDDSLRETLVRGLRNAPASDR
jgi:lysophospholipase L1-like esterase